MTIDNFLYKLFSTTETVIILFLSRTSVKPTSSKLKIVNNASV